MDAKNIAKEILKDVGGKENVSANVACMTRLRLGIKDNDKVDVDALKRIDGVLAVVQADTLQVVLGPGKVNKIAEPFAELTGVALGSDSDDGDVSSDSQLDQVKDIAKENKKRIKPSTTNHYNVVYNILLMSLFHYYQVLLLPD
jgi:Phosphotransferase system IIB components